MELNEFAKIGKAVLSKAIGLQKNYTEEYVKVSNILNEGISKCYDCPVYKEKQFLSYQSSTDQSDLFTQKCSSCSSAVWNTNYKVVRRRINERNKYGYQPTLKSNAIKLLILYHFLQPDSRGFVKNISKKDLAKALGCTVSTVNACNKVLSDYNYCFVSDSGIQTNYISVYLTDYKNYHKTAEEGGRGYLTFSVDMLNALLSVHSLNSLRIQIKGLLEIDSSRLKKISETTATATYHKLRGFLPKYCKNNVIRKALQEKTSILSTSVSASGVEFTLNSSFSITKLRSFMLGDAKDKIVDFISSVNDLVCDVNYDLPDKKEVAIESLQSLGILKADNYKELLLSLDDYSSLASLAVQYNLQIVITSLLKIYNSYVLSNKPVNNVGALCRTFIRNNYSGFSVA